MLNSSKLISVSALSAEERYEYFIRKVCDFEQIWGLYDNGWLMTKIDDLTLLPIWPEAGFAVECATKEWSNAIPRAISVGDFLARWLPGLKIDGFGCLVFMTPSDKGFALNSDSLHERLVDESSQYQ